MNTLRVQLQEEYRVMESLTNYLKNIPPARRKSWMG